MKKGLLSYILILSIVISAVSFANIIVSADPVNNSTKETFRDRIKSDFNLVWNDEFDGDTLDSTKWQYDSDKCSRNSEAQMYSNGPEDGNVYLEDGKLVLKAKKETAYNSEGETKKYTSGEISSHGKANFRYGYFEFNAKLPKGDNTFPAIWMMGYDYNKGGCNWPHSGEIDIMESLGGGYTWSTLHYSRYGQSGNGSHTTTGAGKCEPSNKTTLTDDYHNYWMYWTDKYIVIGVDDSIGNIVDITTPALAQSFRNYDEYIIFDFAMAPFNATIKEADTDDWHFYIDYARVYQPSDDSMYDDYNIIEAENTLTDNPSGTGYSDTTFKYIGNAKVDYINSVFTNLDAGTYDVYVASNGRNDQSKVGVYKASINGEEIGQFDNSVEGILQKAQNKVGTVKITEDNLPFELKLQCVSGKNNDLQVDKYFLVKTDSKPDYIVDSTNCKNLSDEVTVTNEVEFDKAFSEIYDQGTIRLGADITLTNTKSIRRSCTIDLNGHTLNTGALNSCFAIKKTISITMKNGNVIANGNSNSQLDYFFKASEVYSCKVTYENINTTIGAKKMSTGYGSAFFGEYYGGCTYSVKNCEFNITATSEDETMPIVLSGSDSGVLDDTYNNVIINGNGYCSPFRLRTGGNDANTFCAKVYNCNINNCKNIFYSIKEVTNYAKFIIANSNFSENTAFTNYDKNINYVIIAENNTLCDAEDNSVELTPSLGDFSVKCTHEYSDATCCEPATCKYCFGTTGTSLGGHVAGNEVVVDPDCINTGSKTIYCTVCQEVLSTETIPINEHKFIFEYQVEPTCEKEGYKVYKCTECGLEQQRSFTDDAMPARVAHIPDPSKHNVVNATCTMGGYEEDYCTVCKTTYKSRYYRGSHKYIETVVAGNCLNDGYTLYTCSVCGDEYKSNITAATGTHVPDESTKTVTEPMCTTEGYTTYSCTICKEIYKTDIVESLDHSFTNYISNNDATCTSDGTKTAKCDRCDYISTITDVGSIKSHTPVVDEAVAATCTQKGLTEGSHCSVCDTVIVEQEIVEPLGHKLATKNAKKATYFTCGYTGDKVCSVCGEVIAKGKSMAKLKLKTPSIKLIPGSKKITVKYGRIKDAKKYQVYIKIGGKWIKAITDKTYFIKKKIKKGTKCYVKVRALTTSGKKIAYSSFGKTKNIKAK